MSSYAKVILVGNLGRDGELKYTQNQKAVLDFSLAVSERFGGGGESGSGPEAITTWYRISLWGRQAESLKPYLLKGKQVLVEGRLRPREYTDREGKNRISLDVRADGIVLLGSRQGSAAEAGGPPQELARDDNAFADDDIPF